MGKELVAITNEDRFTANRNYKTPFVAENMSVQSRGAKNILLAMLIEYLNTYLFYSYNSSNLSIYFFAKFS